MISIRNFDAVAAAVLAIMGSACSTDDAPPAAGAPAAAELGTTGHGRPRAVTFINPVLPGDHPDMNVFVEGKDFYMTGSSFNITPNVEISHSTDLVHWERLSRVVSPEWPELRNSTTGVGTWGGFIVKIAHGYRVYFAANFHQFFAEAPSLAGPWTDPTELNMFPYTPPGAQVSFNRGNGGDNSVFVDDDGKTYMLMKAGQCAWNGLSGGRENNFGINILIEIDPVTGMLIPESTRDLSFVNDNVANGGCGDPARDPAGADLTHWAEGPSMTKRDGLYYYFVTTKTECGGDEFVWRSPRLSSDPADWTPLGALTASQPPFAGAQHSSAPFQAPDGTWWALFHSYECTGGWLGKGRQGLLGQILWTDDGVPKVGGTWTTPAPAPALPSRGIPLLTPHSDTFDDAALSPAWTFYGPTPLARISLHDRPGWLRVKPEPGKSVWVVQKDALHASAQITRLAFTPAGPGDAAGLRVGNPIPAEDVNRFDPVLTPASVELSLARVWDGGDKIRLAVGSFAFNGPPVLTTSATVPAPPAGTVWLKLVRANHQATGWYSTDQVTWHQVGGAVDTTALDNYDPVGDGWIGNQAGVFAANASGDFDSFAFRDGFTALPASEPDQRSAGQPVASAEHGTVLGGLSDGDWVMYGGIDLGGDARLAARAIELTVATAPRAERRVDIWLDRLDGARVASCALPNTGGLDRWRTVRCPLAASGTHDVYLQVTGGRGEIARLASLRFVPRHRAER